MVLPMLASGEVSPGASRPHRWFPASHGSRGRVEQWPCFETTPQDPHSQERASALAVTWGSFSSSAQSLSPQSSCWPQRRCALLRLLSLLTSENGFYLSAPDNGSSKTQVLRQEGPQRNDLLGLEMFLCSTS